MGFNLPVTLYFTLIVIGNATFSFSVKEEQPVGTFVGQLSGIDPDGIYTITSECDCAHYFQYEKTSETLKTTDVIDRESLSSDDITLKFSGTDSSHQKVLVVIDVTIIDINDQPPHFSVDIFSIEVAEGMGEQTFDLPSWSDGDTGDNGLLKRVQLVNMADQNWPFQPILQTTGTFQKVMLRITGSLDREEVSRYELTVEIEDKGHPSLSGTLALTIIVQDVNDNSPVFTDAPYSFSIPESVTIPYKIERILATDADEGDNGLVRYFVSQSTNIQYFSIHSTTGVLSLIREVDFENCPYLAAGVKGYTLTLTVQDSAPSPRKTSTSVTVTITDVNDNYPVMTFYSPYMINGVVKLQENLKVHSYAATIIVSDKDSGDNGRVDVSIRNGALDRFTIQETNGILVLTADVIDREEVASYGVEITARDRGIPPLETTKTLTIEILDVNDNAPTFTKPLYKATVAENVVIGTDVVDVLAKDPDFGENGTVTYRISSQSGGENFKVSPSTGRVSTIQKLDADEVTLHVLNITARDGGSPSLSGYTIVEVTVSDVNDNSPVFPSCPMECEVSESLPVGEGVCTVKASDRDSGDNGAVSHSISGGWFNIDAGTGAITLAKDLDYETSQRHQATVTARDGGNPRRTTTCELVVMVTDVNDESPVFHPSSYSTAIPEGVLYSRILQVSATDADEGDTITYQISPTEGKFKISSDGVISNTEKLYFTAQDQYSLTISAVDTAGNTAQTSASVTISILQDNDYLPIFPEGLVDGSVTENVQIGTEVLVLKASTSKSCTLSYSISSSHFSVDSSTGKVSTKVSPDYETTQFYTFEATAKCNQLTGYAVVKVSVTDQNDNQPVCDGIPSSIEVSEDAPIGTTVYELVCEDADSGINGELDFTTTSQYFSVIDGDVAVRKALDREIIPSHTVVISVCDKGSPQHCSTVTLSITLLDVNDNTPQFSDPLVFYISEGVKVNHEVGSIRATDKDEGLNSLLSYSLLNSVPEFSLFGSGQIILERLLDFEKVDRYFLNVRVSDQGDPSLSNTTIVTIVVEDANDNAPVFQDLETDFSIREDISVPVDVTTLRATDRDSGVFGQVRYQLLNNENMFSLGTDTGVLTLDQPLDYESSTQSYQVRVQAFDGGTPPLATTVTLTITVLDCNDNPPVFSQDPYTVVIPENTAVGSPVVTVRASDKDGPLNNQISYSFLENQQVFRLNGQSGVITTRRVLDFETQPRFNVSVVATDNGTPSLSGRATVIVELSDVNDNSPVFVSDTIEIGVVESTSPMTVILKVEATDADSGLNGKISYTLSSNPNGLFSVESSTGNLVLLQKLSSSSTVYTVKVTASDHGSPPKSAEQTIKITVIEVNNNVPIFVDGISAVWVPENVAIGRKLFTVLATDADSGPAGVVHYNLTSELLAVDRTSGAVRTRAEIDREAQSRISVKICATDQASPVSQQLGSCKVVTVKVSDENDNSPSFEDSKSPIYVHESTVVGIEFIKVNATDPDEGANGTIAFSITSSDPCVSIHPTSGALKLVTPVDYESDTTACTFTVQASDKGVPPLSTTMEFLLLILDDNDNTPVFTNPSDQRAVYFDEGVTVGSIVYTVTATDADSGDNGKIIFSLSPSVKEFTVNSTTGEVTLNTKVSNSFKTSVTIKAEDCGTPVLSSFMIVKFEYREENTAPVCPGAIHVSKAEDLVVGSIVHTMACYDLDFTERGSLTYSFLDGNYHNTFSISDHGKIILASPLDYETTTSYTLLVLAADGGSPSLMTTATVGVVVDNVNDNAPIFKSEEILVEVDQGAGVGDTVATVSATDPDGGSVSYAISNLGDACSELFNVGSSTGRVKVAESLESFPVTQSPYCNLNIEASDGELSSTMLLVIKIRDSDLTAPSFYSDSSFTVPSTGGYIYGAVGAVDIDPSDREISYSLQSKKRSSSFVVHPETGVITCPGGGCSTATLGVVATGRTKSSSRSISISVVNTSPPNIFSQTHYNFQVLESATSTVDTVTLTTPPSSISIQGGNNNNSFAIDAAGHLTVNNSLDFETWSSYNITLCATKDSVSVFASVFIQIIDINDNSPLFLPAFSTITVPGNLGEGSVVGSVVATDADSGNYGSVQYYLDSPSNLFSVDQTSGEISVAISLQQVTMDNRIRLGIRARDMGIPSLVSNLMTVVITIETVATNPVFEKGSYEFSVYADSTANTLVGQVAVVSGGSDSQFSFVQPNSHFSLYPMSGIVVQKGAISSTNEVHTTKVKASSVLDSSFYSTVDVTFTIIQSICSPNPCRNGGVCLDKVNDFICECVQETAGKTCECRDEDCSNHGKCFHNSTITACLCEDGQFRSDCLPGSDSTILLMAVGCGVALALIIITVLVICVLRARKRKREKKEANTEFDAAVTGGRSESNQRRVRGGQITDNIRMNPIHISNLDLDTKGYDSEYNAYTNHDYHLNSPHYSVHSGSATGYTPRSFNYAASDSGRSSQCTEAVIFRKLEQVDILPGDQMRRDKDSGLAGSLKSLCHFDTSSQLDYLVDWGGPKVNNLRNVLDLEGTETGTEGNEDGPVKEEFV